MVYMGEGDNVFTRLTTHDKDETKDFWTRCAVVISKDQNLTKAHGRYIESRLISIGHKAGRATITNGTAPPLPPLPEPDVADMEFFLAQIQMVFPVLGFGFLQPKPTASGNTGKLKRKESPLFTLNIGGAKATAREIGEEFIVLKGSTARREGNKTWTSYRALREQLVTEGKLVDSDDPNLYAFADDVAFRSPSAGATVVSAGNLNGRTMWKIADSGETYQDWHDKRVEAAVLEKDTSKS
jgi:hypothetical protein